MYTIAPNCVKSFQYKTRLSHESGDTVTFLKNQAGVDCRFALAITDEGVSHRISGSANPEDLSLAAIGKQTVL